MPNDRAGKTKDVLKEARQRLERIEKTGTTFLLTDMDMALTLTRIASDAPEDSERKSRNLANARRAYDEVSRISRRARLSYNERKDVDEKLAELRSALRQLGEEFAETSGLREPPSQLRDRLPFRVPKSSHSLAHASRLVDGISDRCAAQRTRP